jgi:mRNA interferase MazF
MSYIPSKGDIVWVEFNPQRGHEQAGHRPALVISPYEYNSTTSLAIVVPITSKIKGYPFEVKINGDNIQGVALADQVKSLDFGARNFKFIEKAESVVIIEVLYKLKVLLGI